MSSRQFLLFSLKYLQNYDSGLHYIEEFLPETDGTNYEPMYGCTLCCVTQVGVVPMVAHIVGSKHRWNEVTTFLKICLCE